MPTEPAISRVKLERKKKLEKLQGLEQMRASLPVLTRDDIRKFRMPYHLAIQEELTEKGFINSAEFIRQLLDYQKNFKEANSFDYVIQSRPWLFESTKNLDRLSEGLIKAEENHLAEDINGELYELLTLAYFYGFGNSDWWWLSDQIFEQCVEISENHTSDLGFRKAEIRYIFGKYLIEQDLDSARGVELLNVARDTSEGFLWTASNITMREEDSIFIESCTILYNFIMKQIKGMYLMRPQEALELCTVAKRRGADSCIPKADVLFLQGKCEMEANKARSAIDSFRKAQLLFKNLDMIPEYCECRISLALAYLECGEWDKTYAELESLLEFVESRKMEKYVALSYTYIGVYYLNQGTPENATPFLEKAMDIFHELNDVSNREFVKNLACISKGQETIERYSDLILGCESKNLKINRMNMAKLLLWKDMRVPFTEEEESSRTSHVEEEEEKVQSEESVKESMSETVSEEMGEEEEIDEEVEVHDLNADD